MSKRECITKLLLCPQCSDVLKLIDDPRTCACGRSGGRYLEDGLHAEVWGEAVPLGFSNLSLVRALRRRPEAGHGATFEAFVIPRRCSTVRVSPRPNSDT